MNILPSGSHGLLLELDTLEEVLATYAALEDEPPAGVVDLVPTARTILVAAERGTDLAGLAERLRSAGGPTRDPGTTEEVVVPVRYDGEDLEEAATLLGWTPEELVARHRAEEWTVAFCGFAPGFGYCTGRRHGWTVPRRSSPRTRVPAGSLALAGEFTGVYPRESPGGWQLIGHAEVDVFDLAREPAALLRPGVRVRFVEYDR